MTYRLVTLADIKQQLLYDDTGSDAALLFRLDATSEAIINYIDGGPAADDWTTSSGLPLVDAAGNPQVVYLTDSNGDNVLDSNGDPIGVGTVIPGSVRAAVICSMSAWDQDRGADFLTPAVVSLLMRYRDPIAT